MIVAMIVVIEDLKKMVLKLLGLLQLICKATLYTRDICRKEVLLLRQKSFRTPRKIEMIRCNGPCLNIILTPK